MAYYQIVPIFLYYRYIIIIYIILIDINKAMSEGGYGQLPYIDINAINNLTLKY